MRSFEQEYVAIVKRAMRADERMCRNGVTRSFFGGILNTPSLGKRVPLLQGRQIFYKGIIGEFAAMLRGPKHIKDFEKFNCNYWKQWAKPDGSIELDYGNAWLIGGQIEHVVKCLEENPFDRRMLITGWRPERIAELDLPCCHYAYQFYVRKEAHINYIDIMWHQRSTDVMIGLPSDLLLAYLWLVVLCKATSVELYVPGRITMTLGDTHIYKEHYDNAYLYLNQAHEFASFLPPTMEYNAKQGTPVTEFNPELCVVYDYTGNHHSKISFEVKA